MRQATFVGVVLAFLTHFPTNAAQIPLYIDHVDNSWDLNVAPNVSATGHLVFDTVSSFLQHWPNTRYRNGHTLVPGTVPVGTLLYHGRGDLNLPTVPDWTATDPEHSYMFCRGTSDEGCWHLTIVAARPLQVLYFDGSSAAKMRDGPMDTQDVVGWGQVVPDRYFDERNRIIDLCNWGKPLGIDGYVRMEMDFEIMLCDFTAGVEVVSMANIASRGRGGPGGPRHRNVSEETYDATIHQGPIAASGFEVIHSGSWHNRYPGDRRIKLDLTHLISFYDTALVPSLVAKRLDVERWDHRLLGITPDDIAAVRDRLVKAYTAPLETGSGIDWETLFKVVVDRYEDRFEMVRYVLNATADDTLVTAKNAMAQFRVMLTPYILHTAIPASRTANTWAVPVFKFCATSHTEYIKRSAALSAKLTASEKLLLNAVDETNREICRVIVGIWAEGVVAGLDDALPVDNPVQVDGAALTRKWQVAVDDLMAWLDWSVWVKCRPECGFEEICYLPTWPFRNGPGGGGGGGPPGGGRGDRPPPGGPSGPGGSPGGPPASQVETLVEDYLRPQPRCVRRLEPYAF
ncbi:hypothetical protein DFH09DRAFT_1179204 [Mycena vulgaris]|nr:hypothetical protein DFH09DRAFT_1179204 [Mycena vulgaris]